MIRRAEGRAAMVLIRAELFGAGSFSGRPGLETLM